MILAPAFEGRKEIWDALRGACFAIDQNDIDLAQSSVYKYLFDCFSKSVPSHRFSYQLCKYFIATWHTAGLL